MHELHLMREVVKTVETELDRSNRGKLSVVRLKVSALSHLFTHNGATLQAAFQLTARGTRAEGVDLEIIPTPSEAWCPACQRSTVVTGLDETCSTCGGLVVADPSTPEVVIHELVIKE